MISKEKRPSPSDSATLFKTGTKKKGNDGNMWMVKENKNGVKRWTKVSKKTESKEKSEYKKTSKVKKPEEDRIKFMEASFSLKVIKPTQIKKYLKHPIFDNLYKNIIPKIKKLKIEFYIVPLPLSYDNYWWTDYTSEYLSMFYGEQYYEKSFISMEVRLNQDLTINYNQRIYLSYNLNKEQLKIISDLFSNELPYNYLWSGKTSHYMFIDYKKSKTKYKVKEITDPKIYPSLYVRIVVDLKSDKKLNKLEDEDIFNNLNPFTDFPNFAKLLNKISKKYEISLAQIDEASNKKFRLFSFIIDGIEDKKLIQELFDLSWVNFKNYKLKIYFYRLNKTYIYLDDNTKIKIKDYLKK